MWFFESDEQPNGSQGESDSSSSGDDEASFDSLDDYSYEDYSDDEPYGALTPFIDENLKEIDSVLFDHDTIEDGYLHDKNISEVNFDTETIPPLYHYIHTQEWAKVMKWVELDPAQIKTWVYRKEQDDGTKIRWKLLPLHASIIFKCPKYVLKALIDAYPEACSKHDDQGQLPIHLACRSKNPDYVTCSILLKAYPDGGMAKDKKGRVPKELLSEKGKQKWTKYFAKLAMDAENKGDDDSMTKEPLDAFVEPEKGKDADQEVVLSEHETTVTNNMVENQEKPDVLPTLSSKTLTATNEEEGDDDDAVILIEEHFSEPIQEGQINDGGNKENIGTRESHTNKLEEPLNNKENLDTRENQTSKLEEPIKVKGTLSSRISIKKTLSKLGVNK